jgi:predicted  nucleic acid-binding Zn-ribbon protein
MEMNRGMCTRKAGLVMEEQAAVAEDVLARYRRILKSKKDATIVLIQSGAWDCCHM